MQKYETLFVLKPDMSEEDMKALLAKITDVIAKNGEVEEVEEWGLKKLAYKIANKYRDGYYFLINFKGNNECLSELNHVYRITENIIRDIVVTRN